MKTPDILMLSHKRTPAERVRALALSRLPASSCYDCFWDGHPFRTDLLGSETAVAASLVI
jgi:hypothetical protein